MAEQGAKEFFEKIDQDPELRKKVSTSMGAIVAVAHEHGFKMTAADLAEHLRQRWAVKPPGHTATNECTI